MEQYINEFLNNLDAPYSTNTMLAYGTALRQYYDWARNNTSDCLSQINIQKWFEYLSAYGVKSNTQHQKRAALRSFFDYCMEKGYICSNPALTVEIRALPALQPAKTNTKMIKLSKVNQDNLRDRAIVQLMLDTGLRLNEFLRLNVSDVKFSPPSLKIDSGKNKEVRKIALTFLSARLLKNYLDTRNDHHPALFITRRGRRFTRQGLNKLFNKYVDADQSEDMLAAYNSYWRVETV